MWQNKLYDLFLRLRSNKPQSNTYEVESIDAQLPHKLGCSKDGTPVFFVECSDEEKTQDIKLTLFSVMYNRLCDVIEHTTQERQVAKYAVIQLNSDEEEFQKYFLDVMYMILKKLPSHPENLVLDAEIKKIITLFTNAKKPSKEAIRGLFAELLVIDASRDPYYLLRSWHVAANDPFDFNDGKDKIEVKSSTKEGRSHKFALRQLLPPPEAKLVVASIFVLQSGFGMNVYELMDRISLRIQDDLELLLYLREMVTATVGKYFNEVSEYRFDYGVSMDSYALYNSKDIPCIPVEQIPNEITNVHFTVDMSGLKPVNSQEYKSDLINALL